MSATIHALLADDQALVRLGTHSLLQKNNEGVQFIVTEAKNSEETLQLVAGQRFDIVILDFRFPTLGGIQTAKLIKKTQPTLPILVLSNYARLSYAKEMIRAGATGYVLKDIQPDTLVEAILSVIAKKRYYSNAIAVQLLTETNGPKTQTDLSKREILVLDLVARGLTSKEIAQRLFLSKNTINKHRYNIKKKLGVQKGIDFVKAIPLLSNDLGVPSDIDGDDA